MSTSDAVTVAYVHSNEVAHSWHMSLVELIGWDLAHDARVMRGGWIAVRYGTEGLPAARNEAVQRFLDDKGADWLFWTDTDMGYAPDTVDRLLAVAHPTDRPIVGALCFAQKEITPDGMGGYRCAPRPTIFDWVEHEGQQGFQGRAIYPVNALVRCAGTGSACVLIHRNVLAGILSEHGPVWYTRAKNTTTGQLMGEDLSFCMRAVALGIPVHVHTGVRATHLKHFWLQEQDYWAQAVPPAATDRVAVLVPVMQRPDNARPFMDSLRASTGLATAYAICDHADEDTERAWHDAGAVTVDITAIRKLELAGTFAQKINIGYEHTDEPWLFITGDDVRFHPGWLDHAQAVAGMDNHVIGTNDLANPRVMAGEHATHLLIRRTYVDEHGASWDGPKVLAHEGYGHWYVDDEIVTVAKQRGVWAMALGANVEHRHPLFGTAETDHVYELGQGRASADRKTFKQRCRRYL